VPRTFTSTPSTSKIRIFGRLGSALLFRVAPFQVGEDLLGTLACSFVWHCGKQKVSLLLPHRVKPGGFRKSGVAGKSGALLHWTNV